MDDETHTPVLFAYTSTAIPGGSVFWRQRADAPVSDFGRAFLRYANSAKLLLFASPAPLPIRRPSLSNKRASCPATLPQPDADRVHAYTFLLQRVSNSPS